MKKRRHIHAPINTAHKPVASAWWQPVSNVIATAIRDIKGWPAGLLSLPSRMMDMAIAPARASEKEIKGLMGWRSGVFNLIPALLFVLVILSINVFSGPEFVLTTPDGQNMLIPKELVIFTALFNIFLSLLFVGALGTIVLYFIAKIAGGRAGISHLFHLMSLVLSITIPLSLIIAYLNNFLPRISAPGGFYSIGDLAIDLYLIYLLSHVTNKLFGLPFARSVAICVIYRLVIFGVQLLSMVAAGSQAAAGR